MLWGAKCQNRVRSSRHLSHRGSSVPWHLALKPVAASDREGKTLTVCGGGPHLADGRQLGARLSYSSSVSRWTLLPSGRIRYSSWSPSAAV
jgi:hypothetical protein